MSVSSANETKDEMMGAAYSKLRRGIDMGPAGKGVPLNGTEPLARFQGELITCNMSITSCSNLT